MGYNTQFPQWIIDSSIANQQLGQQMGRNILEGLKFQEQKRQYEQERQDKAPFLQAQQELAQANLTGQILQNQQRQTALDLQNIEDANRIDAMKFESGVARSQGGFSNPENYASYLEFVRTKPKLDQTVWGQNMRKQFEIANKNTEELNKIKERGAQEIAQEEARKKGGYIQLQTPYGTVGGTPDQIKKMKLDFPNLFPENGYDVSPAATLIEDPLTGEMRATYRFPKGTSQEQINSYLNRGSGSSGMAVPAPGAPQAGVPGPTTSGQINIPGFTIRAVPVPQSLQ